MWIEFEPGAPAQVEMQSWGDEQPSGIVWPRRDIVGRAWVSSDGTGLGRDGGPDLLLDLEWNCMMSGSPQPGGRRLWLRSDQLAR